MKEEWRIEVLAAFQCADLEGAERLLRAVLVQKPWDAEAVQLLAANALLRGQSATAVALIGTLLQEKKTSHLRTAFPAWSKAVEARLYQTLGRALLAEGQQEAARLAFHRAVSLLPEEAASQAGLGETLMASGRFVEALAVLEQAQRLAPKEPVLCLLLVQVYYAMGQIQQAEMVCRQLVRLCPEDGAVRANWGAVLFASQRLNEAEHQLQEALRLGTRTAETLTNLGLVRLAQGFVMQACMFFEEAQDKAPRDMRVCLNYGTALYEAGRYEAAEAAFHKVECQVPDTLEAHRAAFNRSALLLARGQWCEGWACFEQRRVFLPQNIPPVLLSRPLWDGTAGDEPIALYAEQGLGDMVQFLRYLPEVARRRPVRLCLPDEICRFVQRFMDIPKECLRPQEGHVVAHQSLLSLPYCLGHDAPPKATPYFADFLAGRKEAESGLIGVCWAGNPSYPFDRRRSVPFEQLVACLEPLVHKAGMRFISLQRNHPGVDWMGGVSLRSLTELAKAIECCSLVISVDTLVAHMAGALGRPLWLLNRYGGDWRWRGAAWYADVRLFSPPALTDPYEGWEAVLKALCEALKERECSLSQG